MVECFNEPKIFTHERRRIKLPVDDGDNEVILTISNYRINIWFYIDHRVSPHPIKIKMKVRSEAISILTSIRLHEIKHLEWSLISLSNFVSSILNTKKKNMYIYIYNTNVNIPLHLFFSMVSAHLKWLPLNLFHQLKEDLHFVLAAALNQLFSATF